MTWIVRRKVRESWRDAVSRRLATGGDDCLADGLRNFDDRLRAGEGEAEAAYAVLQARELLWFVDAPGFTADASQPPTSTPDVPSA